jgi:hypothetical protein
MRQPGTPRANDERDQGVVRPARPPERRVQPSSDGAEPRNLRPAAGGREQLDDLRTSLDAVGSDIHGRITELTGALERFEQRQRDETSREITALVGRVLAERDARLERVESAVTAAAGFIRRLKASITDALAARDNRMAEIQHAVTLTSQRLDSLAEGVTSDVEVVREPGPDGVSESAAAAIAAALDSRDKRIDAVVRALQALESRQRTAAPDPALATMKDALTTRDARLEELESAIVTTTERLETLDRRLAESPPAATETTEAAADTTETTPAPEAAAPPGAGAEESDAGSLEAILASRDERIEARIDSLVKALKVLEARDRTKAGDNGQVEPTVVERQIEAALARRDATLDQVQAALTANSARLDSVDRRLEAAEPSEPADDARLREIVGSVTDRVDRLAAAVTEALALRDAQLEEVLDAFTSVQARVDEVARPVSGATSRGAPG